MKGSLLKAKPQVESIRDETDVTAKPDNTSGETKPSDNKEAKTNAKSSFKKATKIAPRQPDGSVRATLLLFVLSFTTSGLLFLSYFPVAWAAPAWFALVPLLMLVRTEIKKGWVFLFAMLSGLAFFVPILSWMGEADNRMILLWFLLATYCSLYTLVGIWLLRFTDKVTKVPLTFAVPIVWVTLEFFRSFMLTGFAWYFLGHSQHMVLPMIQIADLGGVYAVTFVLAAFNGLWAEWVYAIPQVRQRLQLREPPAHIRFTNMIWPRVWQSVTVSAVVIGALVYGSWRLGQTDFEKGPTIALLQGNIDQRIRNGADPASNDPNAPQFQKKIIQSFGTLCQAAATGDADLKELPKGTDSHVDLIIWPESSMWGYWLDYDRKDLSPKDIPAQWAREQITKYRELRWMTDICRANMLLGWSTLELVDPKKNRGNQTKRYNSALLLNKTGTIGGRYDKMHRVPFGEYMPLRYELPFMKWFSPYKFDYSISIGQKLTRFKITTVEETPPEAPNQASTKTEKLYRFGVLICYEDTDPYMARQYGSPGNDGAAVDFLVNISNDGWFNGSSEHSEHLAISRFRAVETRRSLARSVNMGISAIIDGNGRVLKPNRVTEQRDIHFWDFVHFSETPGELPVSEWDQFVKEQGIVTGPVPIDDRYSLYVHWGDWFAVTCSVVLVSGLLVGAYFANRHSRKIKQSSES
ncbi:MAG: apolipoprotein N-acyltransferase [Gemmataceae bacterium]